MPFGSILIIGAMVNGRESTQNSQVGFDKNPQSHDPEPYQNNVYDGSNGGKSVNHNAWEKNRESRDHAQE
jgi:hypothetical protein